MERTPDDKRELLRQFIKERGLRIARWAKESGVSANSIYNFLNGHSAALDLRTYAKLARTQGVPVWQVSGELPDTPAPTGLFVSGDVQAGVWRDAAEWERGRWRQVDVPVPDRFRSVAKALEVVGTSMDQVYPDGSIVVWVDQLDFRPVRDGDRVIVYSYRDDDAIEATVKEYRETNGTRWLWPRSFDPAHQQPVNVSQPGDRVRSIEIKGIVIGSYRPEVH